MANIGVIGAGSWGTALALLLDKNGHAVNGRTDRRKRKS